MKPTLDIFKHHLSAFCILVFFISFMLTICPVAADVLPDNAKISAAITFEKEVDSYTFTANAGENIRITMTDTSATGDLRPSLQLFNPSGASILFGGVGHGPIVAYVIYTVAETGTYTVLASDQYYANTGTYNLYFAHMPGANEHGTLINDGVHQHQIDPGDLDTYTFTANAGESIRITMTDTSATGNLRPSLQLFNPSGASILFGGVGHGPIVAYIIYTVTETGTYTVLASDQYYANTGTYNLYFAHMPGANEHGTLINDGVHQHQIDPGDLDTYTFTANAGENIRITMTDTSDTGALSPSLQLFNPSGASILFGGAGHGPIVAYIIYTVAETGTYTVLASDQYYANTGNYELNFTTDGQQGTISAVPALSIWGLILLSFALAWMVRRRMP